MVSNTKATAGRLLGQTKPARIPGRWERPLQSLAIIVALLVVWEGVKRLGILESPFVPSPTEVIATGQDWIFATEGSVAGHRYSGTWVTHAWASAQRVFAGFAVASLVGVTLGILIGWFRAVETMVDPIVQLLRPIPVSAWVPFSIVFFGLDPMGAVFLISLGAFFPIVVNSTAGAQRTPKVLVRAASMLGTPRRALLWRVVVPSALPSIFTGLRLGMGIAWVLVIISEMLAVRSGLGYVMWDAYQLIRMDLIVATMISVGVLGFAFDGLILKLRRLALGWSEGIYR